MSGKPAALALYRALWRHTRDLPRQFKGYYRNAIRSGFVSHCDEDDPEILQRIHKQARLDADWLVNKYAAEVASEKEKRQRRKAK